MAQGAQRTGWWSRGAVTLLVVVWLAVAIGNWLAHHEKVQEKLGQGEREGTTQEVSIPEATPRPWRADISELQAQIDAENTGSLQGESDQEVLVVATPVPAVAPAAVDSAATESTGSWGLVFASYRHDDQALAMMTRLSMKGISSHIEQVPDSEGNTVCRVQGDQVFDSEEEAQEAKQSMVKLGFDATVISI